MCWAAKMASQVHTASDTEKPRIGNKTAVMSREAMADVLVFILKALREDILANRVNIEHLTALLNIINEVVIFLKN